MAKDPKRIRIILLWIVAICALMLLMSAAFLAVLIIREDARPPVEPTTTAAAETQAQTLPPETTEPTEATTQPQITEQTENTEQTQTTEQTETTEATEETTQETTAPDAPAQPATLTAMLEQNGTTYETLAEKNCTQLVTVQAEGTKASIRFFVCEDGQWSELQQLSCQGCVGRSGIYRKKQEGDGSTPSGLYSITCAFYIDEAPETTLDMFQITQDTYWVDDPDSVFYNQRVEGTENKDWKSAEHMISYSVYRYGFVVDYNVAAQYNAGSAIFFHISDRPTAGCIGTSEQMVLAYLAQMDKQRNPHILIVAPDA